MKWSFLFLLLIIGLKSFSQSLYFPPKTTTAWDTLSLSSQNFCQQNVDSLYDFLDSNHSKAFMLLVDGKIILEKYFDSFTKDSAWYWASAGKTLTAFLVGIAQAEGFLKINDSSSAYLDTAWTTVPRNKEDSIKIVHQLSMTTGLSDTVDNPDCTLDTCLQYFADAGSRWAYHNAPYTLLDSVIKSATGKSINAYHFQKLRNPIGMTGAYFKLAYNNVYFSKARAMARFGLLMLNKGIWDQDTILKDSVYFKQMTSSSQSLNPSYGYLTWLNGKSSYKVPQSQFSFSGSVNKDAPSDMYAAFGKNGQIISVTPSKNMVWIRMGNAPESGSGLVTPSFSNQIWKRINKLNCQISNLNPQEEIEANLKIFPNPFRGKLALKSNFELEFLNCYDLSGKKLLSWESPNYDDYFDLSSLKNGVYIMEVRTANYGTVFKKIIKQ